MHKRPTPSFSALHTAAALALSLALATPAQAAAPPAFVEAALAPLREATFFTCQDVKAALPIGEIAINSAVVGVFPGLQSKLEGVLLGDVSLNITCNPGGKDTLNLLCAVLGGDSARRSYELKVRSGYLRGSPSGGAQVLVGGKATAARKWDQLEDSEREQFSAVYLQSYSDALLAGSAPAAGPGAGGAQGRAPSQEPQGKAVYASMWVEGLPGQSGPLRLDLSVDESGKAVSIEDYARMITLYQHPWESEDDLHAALGLAGDDTAVRITRADYTWSFTPGSGERPGHAEVRVEAELAAAEPRAPFSVYSAPWLGLPVSATLDGAALPADRQDWTLSFKGSLEPGRSYRLGLSFSASVPQSYAGPGYAGVYRFDATPLWPGEASPCDIGITAALPGSGWNFAFGGPVSGVASTPAAEGASLKQVRFNGASRNCMLIATQFPLTPVDTAWGRLNVYGPPEIASGIADMEQVRATGAMLSYYSALWGAWQPGAQAAGLNLFLIPGESGVQAFEDAGMLFILGGEQSYGSGNTSLPLVAHEAAHLWWGHGVSGPRWFSEGLANYGAAKFMEHYISSGQGQGDPISYRRYLINFAAGHQLGLPLAQLDALGDSAAVYHNSAAYLLTADNRLRVSGKADGLDGVLRSMYARHAFGPALDEAGLGAFIAQEGGPEQAALWDTYVVRGALEQSAMEDPSYRELVQTPEREKYVRLLGWLNPARRKQAQGDFAGALYCAQQGLHYRDEPKDRLLVAQLYLSGGDLEGAETALGALLADPATDSAVALKAHYALAQVFKARGDSAKEAEHLQPVAEGGAAAGLMRESQAAQARLAELGGAD